VYDLKFFGYGRTKNELTNCEDPGIERTPMGGDCIAPVSAKVGFTHVQVYDAIRIHGIATYPGLKSS
jgi:hypothetical protein